MAAERLYVKVREMDEKGDVRSVTYDYAYSSMQNDGDSVPMNALGVQIVFKDGTFVMYPTHVIEQAWSD